MTYSLDQKPDPSGKGPKGGLYYSPSQIVELALAFSTIDQMAADLPALTSYQIKLLDEVISRNRLIDLALFDYPVSSMSSPVFREVTAAMRKTMNNMFVQPSALSEWATAEGGPSKTIYGQALSSNWPFLPLKWIDRGLLLAPIDLEEVVPNEVFEGPSVTSAESDRLKRIIAGIYHEEKTRLSVEPNDFEQIIAELLRHKGYQVELTKRTRDGGFDILAIGRAQGDFPLKFLVECKRYTAEKVGIDVIRQLMYVVNVEQANKGIIATSSYFSADAIKHQANYHPYQLDLRDKNDILTWIRNYGEERLQLRKGK